MPHTPPPNSSHMMPLSSPNTIPSMHVPSVEHVSSSASPSGSSQSAFCTPPRRPYISRRIAAGSSPSFAALGSINSGLSSPEIGRIGNVSYARPRIEAVPSQAEMHPSPQEFASATADASVQNKNGSSKKAITKKPASKKKFVCLLLVVVVSCTRFTKILH
ncbi:unnamed protein product [Linum trigynum]|uniref:Uncharacterized protein n=1 Tax=Linum trigynum TaxID=586398 RepID=A0AAV2FWS0_9ROSI